MPVEDRQYEHEDGISAGAEEPLAVGTPRYWRWAGGTWAVAVSGTAAVAAGTAVMVAALGAAVVGVGAMLVVPDPGEADGPNPERRSWW